MQSFKLTPISADFTDQHLAYLDEMVSTGAFGSNRSEVLTVVAERFFREELPRLLREFGDLDAQLEKRLLRPFHQITTMQGLVDPSGKPLSRKSASARTLVADTRAVDKELLARLKREPGLQFQLSPRRWEELVARLFSELGYQVDLTPASRDGGWDVQVIKKDHLGTALVLVECKRYSADRPVGVEIARELYGTLSARNATQGLIVTTSNFTRGAKEFVRRQEGRMSLADYERFIQWLDDAGF